MCNILSASFRTFHESFTMFREALQRNKSGLEKILGNNFVHKNIPNSMLLLQNLA